MKHCVNCGAEVADEEIMCPECGLAADEKAEAAEADADAQEEAAAVEEAEDVTETEHAGTEDASETEETEEADEADEAGENTEADETDESAEADEQPKNRWSGVATAAVIATAVIVLGLIAFVLYKEGTLTKWWDSIRPKTKSVCTIEDYSEIQVLKSAVEVDDETVDSYIASIVGYDLTDEAVQAYAASIKDCDATNEEELREYARDYIYTYYLHNEMMDYLKSITTVKSYDEEIEALLIAYSEEELDYYSSYYGMDIDTIATYYGYANAEEYETATAHDYQLTAMILDKIMKDKNISYTDEDLRADMEEYLEENGYSDYYTYDEFVEEAGEGWVYLYENLTYKFNIVMEALEPNVVFIDEPAE